MYSKFLDHFKTLRFLLAWYLSLKSKKGTNKAPNVLLVPSLKRPALDSFILCFSELDLIQKSLAFERNTNYLYSALTEALSENAKTFLFDVVLYSHF